MPKISDVEVARLARAAGFRHEAPIRGAGIASVAPGGGELVTMVAVALAESGGNTTAHNDNTGTGDDSYGLWQINMLGGLGPYRRRKYGLSSNQELFAPSVNARVAFGVYSTEGSLGVKHWSGWNSKKYAFYLTRARSAVRDAGESVPEGDPGWEDIPGGESVEGAIDSLKGIADFFKWISDTDNWKRVGYFIGGIIAVGMALYLLVDENTRINPAKYIPQARAVQKVVKGG